MNDYDKQIDQIADYITGKLTVPEIEEFESAVSKSDELKAAVAEMRQLRSGLELYDKISANHIDSELLAIFASDPDSIDDSKITKLKAHLTGCNDCREELLICTPQHNTAKTPIERTGFLMSLRDWLFSSGSIMRPLAGMAILVMLATSVFYYAQRDSQYNNQVAVFDVIPSSNRGEITSNPIMLTQEINSLRLRFRIAGQAINKYTFELNDKTGNNLFILENLSFEDPFDIEIPRKYFTDGKNVLKVKEVAPGNKPVEIDHINLDVTFDK